MATIKCGLARPLWLQHKNQIGQYAKLFGRDPVQHYNNTNVVKALTSVLLFHYMSGLMHRLSFVAIFSESQSGLVQWMDKKNLQWTDKKISIQIGQNKLKFSKFKWLNQDLVGDFQGSFTYQPSIFAAKFIVYSTIHLWFQSIAM